jgi:hypothetical protein
LRDKAQGTFRWAHECEPPVELPLGEGFQPKTIVFKENCSDLNFKLFRFILSNFCASAELLKRTMNTVERKGAISCCVTKFPIQFLNICCVDGLKVMLTINKEMTKPSGAVLLGLETELYILSNLLREHLMHSWRF